MSVRNFARRFRESFGVTPAEFVTRVRVEAACHRLEENILTMEQIAARCGFSSAELLRRACHRILGTLLADFAIAISVNHHNGTESTKKGLHFTSGFSLCADGSQ